MTAPARARFRAPWIALSVAALVLSGTTPAFADEAPPPETTVSAPETPAPAPAPEPAADPAPEPAADPAPETETEEPAEASRVTSVPERETAAAVIASASVSPAAGVSDGSTVTVSGTLPAKIDRLAGGQADPIIYVMWCYQPAGTTVGTPAGRASGTSPRTECEGPQLQISPVANPMMGVTANGTVTGDTWNFSASIAVQDTIHGTECRTDTGTGTTCNVFLRLNHTFHAGNTADPYQHDRYLPVTFTDPVVPGNPGSGGNPGKPGNPGSGTARPSLSVSPSTIDPAERTTVVVFGRGYTGAGAANGVYVQIGSSSLWQPGQTPTQSGWVAMAWVPPTAVSNGAFTTRLTVPAGALKIGTSYGVATFAAHQLSQTNRSLDAWAPLRLAAGAGDSSSTTRTAADAPPTVDGIELASGSASEGGAVTATAEGFEPGESGILVVLYSDPVVLDNNARADASGTVSWSGRLPLGVTGSHTLTFQGSTDAGVPIQVAERQPLPCEIDDARLIWGFKETFRSYLSSTIAKGEWTTTGDASYATPEFTWTGGTGDRNDSTTEALVAFEGGIRFTGHEGALDTTVSKPRIEFSDGDALLLLDIEGATQDGRDVIRVAVPFAELDLDEVTPATGDGVIELADIPATLTDEGSAVFGTYPAGEELDPVTLVLPKGDCATATTGGEEPIAAPATAASTGWPVWVLWLGLALLLAVIAVVAAVLVRRRRA